MHFPTALSSLLVAAAGLTAASPVEPFEAFTAPRVSAATVQKAGGFKDMILSEIQTNTLGASANATAPNRQISFRLADANFNTSTTCTTTWLDSSPHSNSTTRPTSYIPCTANAGVKESYRWYFAGYTALGDFSLQLAHSFSDPANYPPPYDVVGLFATVNVTLTCARGDGGQECATKEGESVRAPINAAVN
ncbi:hypothetical protein O988_08564 [Pseudogymnoascus sp. VKM F-3808]|nr:hypothetical protein O988_08564 [Pseudogymnoascus sp. VKM F-3808]